MVFLLCRTIRNTTFHITLNCLPRKISTNKSDILQCWNKAWTLHKLFLLLNTIEHIALLTPLVLLKVVVDKRNVLLGNSDFPPIADEWHSAHMINLLLASGATIFLAAPIVQSLLAYIYFKYGHPWSRILKAYLF